MIEEIREFNKTITEEQRAKFKRKLGETASELFDAMLNSSNEDQARKATKAFVEYLEQRPMKAASLGMAMTRDQRQMVSKFRENL